MSAPQLVEFIEVEECAALDTSVRMGCSFETPSDACCWEDPVGQDAGRVDDPPPGDIGAELLHHPSDIPRRAAGDGTYGSVRDDTCGRDEFDDAQHPLDRYLIHRRSRVMLYANLCRP